MRHLFRLEACGHAKHFVDGRQSGPALCNAVFDHCAHPLAARDRFEVGSFGLRSDCFSDLRRHLHHLEQALAAAEAAEAAPLAASRAVNDLARLKSQGRKALVAGKIGRGKTIRAFAMLAQPLIVFPRPILPATNASRPWDLRRARSFTALEAASGAASAASAAAKACSR